MAEDRQRRWNAPGDGVAVPRPRALSDSAASADTELVRVPGPDPDAAPRRLPAPDPDELRRSPVPGAAAGPDVSGSDDTELLRLSARRLPPGVSQLLVTLDGRGDPTDATRAGSVGAFIGSATAETRIGRDVRFSDIGPTAAAAALTAVLARGRVGRFHVLRELGRGAMGVVLAAYDEELDRKVAIKLLHAGRGDDASHGRALLLREAQALARVAHPHVVAVHEVGVVEGAVFVAMEYVAGVDLQGWLAAAPRPWREVVAVLRQAGEGLAAAHREGLIHRDFKPSNVLVGDDGRARVADFGLAARRGGPGTAAVIPAGAAMTATLTGDGALVGTPLYMAPELLRGAPATALSDQYAFCVTLYEALYGERPFAGDTLAQLIRDHDAHALPAAPLRAEVPAWLHAAVCRGLARAPEARHPDLAALVDLLARDPEAERRQRRRRAAQIAAAIAGTALLVTALVFGVAAARRWAADRQAEARFVALREQLDALRARGEHDEAARALRSFVALPENHGRPVIARAYLEWAAVQTDPAAAADAYASAYVAARGRADERAALLGLVDRLFVQGRVGPAAAALAVLERDAPDAVDDPALQEVRLAAALARRDLPAARAALAAGDPDGWSPVLEDLSRTTSLPPDHLGPFEPARKYLDVRDVDGDGREELVLAGPQARLFALTPDLPPLRTLAAGPAEAVFPLAAARPGEVLLLGSYPDASAEQRELRLLRVAPDGATEELDRWVDSPYFHTLTADLAGDGRREIYIATEAYTRRLWRIDRGEDGRFVRRPAHPPTDAATSDLTALTTADLDGDGRLELLVTAGPWRAYDLRAYRARQDGELDQVARRSFGAFEGLQRIRTARGDAAALIKIDFQVAPERFPADRPLGEPAGLYVVDLAGRALEILGHLPATPAAGPPVKMARLHVGDLDGDGADELVIDAFTHGTLLVRVRPGEPLKSRAIAGVRPLRVHDLDGDGDAEILATTDDGPRLLVLGTGDDPLLPLPAADVAPRPLPPGIADPVIADAWTHGEQLVAIGLPARTADELSAIARLAGPHAPDLLRRTAELYAATGDHARAAELYTAAAERPDLAADALAAAAAARRRLGEFPAAAELARRRLAVVDAAARPDAEAELAALTAATAPRPALALDFAGPLDPRWRVADPVAVQRARTAGELSVWTVPAATLAEYPLRWDGGPVTLDVEMAVDRVEWGARLDVALVGPDDRPWLSVAVGGFGRSDRPEQQVHVGGGAETPTLPTPARELRGRVTVLPGLGTHIREIDAGPLQRRDVLTAIGPRPPPGPLRLRITSSTVQPGFVTHANLRAIRLTGLTAADPTVADDPVARALVEGDHAAVLAAPVADDLRRVWRIDALLALGRVADASREIAAVFAGDDHAAFDALYARLRRNDELAVLAARDASGPEFVDLLMRSNLSMEPRPIDLQVALLHLAPVTAPPASDPVARQRQVVTDYLLGAAHLRAGEYPAARAAFAAAADRLAAADLVLPAADRLRARLHRDRLALALATGDRDDALRRVRAALDDSPTPYLTLERMQADAALTRLLGPEIWPTLTAELQAARP
jgi:tetratricopeptide (TPR) repeat protein